MTEPTENTIPTQGTEPVANTETAPTQTQTQTTQPQPQIKTFKFNALGREIEADESKVVKWASMGYDYAQKMEAFKQQQADIEARAAEAKKLAEQYGPIDQYAKSNADWWEHVKQSWDNRNNYETTGEYKPPNLEAAALKHELATIKGELQQFRQFATKAEQQAQDAEYWQQLKAIQEKYPHIDLHASDPDNGKTLEFKVLEFAKANDIKKFDVAFKAFYHDQMIKEAEERGRKDAQEKLIKDRKDGVLGTTTQPTKGTPIDLSRMTASQRLKAAQDEYLSLMSKKG